MYPSAPFRKWVTIDNVGLWALQFIFVVGTSIGVLYGVITMAGYEYTVEPQVRLSLRADTSGLANGDALSCSASNQYSYQPSPNLNWFKNVSCATACDSTGYDSTTACFQSGELVYTDDNDMFFATGFVDEYTQRYAGAVCPVAMTANATACQWSSSYLIPSASIYTAKIGVQFQVNLGQSYMRSAWGAADYSAANTLVVVKGSTGQELMRTQGNQVIQVGLMQLLQAAGFGLDDFVADRPAFFPNDIQTGKRPYIRVTGANIAVTMDITNTVGNTYNWKGAVIVVTVKGVPAWVTRKAPDNTDQLGSLRVRTYTGVRVRVFTQGSFQFFQGQQVIYAIALAISWIRTPYYFFALFAVTCLGTLSEVYRRFIFQETNMYQLFNSVSSRMLEVSYGFSDLHDLQEEQDQVWGISLRRLRRRMELLMDSCKALTEEQRDLFIQYVFTHTAGRMPSGKPAVCSDQYLAAACNAEPISKSDITLMINAESQRVNIFESFFMESSMQAFHEEDLTASKNIRQAAMQASLGKETITVSKETRDQVLTRLRLEKDLNTVTQSALTKSSYGQVVVNEQISALEQALRKVEEYFSGAHAYASSAL